MRFLSFVIIINAILLLGSCNKEELSPNSTTDFDVPEVIPNGDENYLIMDSDYIFDQNTLNTFELKILKNRFLIFRSESSRMT